MVLDISRTARSLWILGPNIPLASTRVDKIHLPLSLHMYSISVPYYPSKIPHRYSCAGMKYCCEALQLCVARQVIIGVKALHESFVETGNYTRQLV